MTRYRLYRIEPCPVLKPDGSCEHLLSKCPGCLNDGTREVRTGIVWEATP